MCDEKTKYKVWFSNSNYEPELQIIDALNQDDALILAKAERIRNEEDHTLYKIEEYYKPKG